MKQSKLFILCLLLVGVFFQPISSFAIVANLPSTTENVGLNEKKGGFFQKINQKINKFEQKVQKKALKVLQKMAPNFSDPVEKFFWGWIFGWGLGLILIMTSFFGIPFVWRLGSILMLLGSVCLIIWFIKKFIS
jgi:hypothetical protein